MTQPKNLSERLRSPVETVEYGSFVGHFSNSKPPSELHIEAANMIDTLVAALDAVLIGFDGMQDGNGNEAPELVQARKAVRRAKRNIRN